MFSFARKCGHVIGTDLWSDDASFDEAKTRHLQSAVAKNSFSYPAENITLQHADMRHLPVEDGSMDFAWSTSSIEHVPHLRDLYQVFTELHRVLRPRGHALLTTEFCLGEGQYFLPHLNALDEALIQTFVSQLGGLELVGPTDLDYNYLPSVAASRPRKYARSYNQPSLMHLDYLAKDVVNLVGMSHVVPIGFVLRRNEKPMAAFDGLPLPKLYREADEAWAHLYAGRGEEAAEIAVQYLFGGRGPISLQGQMHFALIFTRAVGQTQNMPANVVATVVDEILRILPKGQLQDGDVLPDVARILFALGRNEESRELFQLAARSPSTLPDTALAFALDYLRVSTTLNEPHKGLELIEEICTDLFFSRIPWTTLEEMIEQLARWEPSLTGTLL